MKRQSMKWFWLIFSLYAGFTPAQDSETRIDMQLIQQNWDQFAIPFNSAPVLEKVRQNLLEWQFPVQVNAVYTHRLEIELGKISRQSVPIGFSFSAGNSDPRAGDFQKTLVLPITCRVSTLGNHQQLASQEQTFAAEPLQQTHDKQQFVQTLSDQISTICFNVLTDLKLTTPKQAMQEMQTKPSWLPNTRIEVQQVPSLDSHPTSTATGPAQEGTKQIVIQNQGSPLILRFGPDRQ
jgi:hypothetical protein